MVSNIVLVFFALMVATAEASLVGIRLVFSQEQLEGMGCTKEEHNTVVSIMHDGVIDLMEQQERSLYSMFADDDGMFNFDDGVGDISDPAWCEDACRAYATGTCQVAYPQCDETRRHLSPRPVSDPAEFARLCMEEEDAVLATIREGVEEVSESCNALLQTKVEVSCADLSAESPVFIPATSSSRQLSPMFAAMAVVAVVAAALV